ncbi:MAG: hypothetical protein ACE15D_16420 [Candidatus Eisenbacteria bacterium]
MLFALPILNSASRRFDEYHRLAVAEIDRAAGSRITVWRFGNPRGSGVEHQKLRPKQLIAADEQDEQAWAEEIRAGTVREHWSKQMLEARVALKIKKEDVPCIAFFTCTPSLRRVGMLRISPAWYESDAGWGWFCSRFCTWLRRSSVRELANLSPKAKNLPDGLRERLRYLRIRPIRNIDLIKTDSELIETMLKDPLDKQELAFLQGLADHAFGRVEVVIRRRRPVLDPPPRWDGHWKVWNDVATRPDRALVPVERGKQDLRLVRLIDMFRAVRNGVVRVQFMHGLPAELWVRDEMAFNDWRLVWRRGNGAGS